MANIDRIFTDEYQPTAQDLLHTYLRTAGITETRVTVNETGYKIVDVPGARSQRRNWETSTMDNADALIFVVPLNGRDRCLVEDHGTVSPPLRELPQAYTLLPVPIY